MKQTQLKTFLPGTMSSRLFASFHELSHDVYRTNGKKIETSMPSGRPVVQNPGGPVDLTPLNDKTMSQMDFVCATGESCLNTEINLKNTLRCASCGFCMHAGCGVEIVASGKVKAPPPEFNHICNSCVILRQLEQYVKYVDHTRVVSMRHPRVKKVIALQWPDIDVIRQQDVDFGLEQRDKKNKELEARKNAIEEAEEAEELERTKQAITLQDTGNDAAKESSDSNPDSSSSSDGDIAEIVTVKPGRVKPPPTFSEDDSDATMSEAHFSDNPINNEHQFDYTGLPETNNSTTSETKNKLPFVTPHKKGRQKKPKPKPKPITKIQPVVKAKPIVNPLPKEDSDEDASMNTNNTETTQKKGDKHRSSKSTASTAASTTASSELLKVYINVNLNVKPVAEKNFSAPIDAALKCCREFLEIIQKVEPSFKLHSWDPDAPEQLICHAMDDFPKTLADLKAYFKQARPMPKGGKLFMKILASYHGDFKSIASQVNWYFQDRNEQFQYSLIQKANVAVVGWLLYSTWNMDGEVLQDTLSLELHCKVALIWRRIADGTAFDKTRDTREDPRAFHIECWTNDETAVIDGLRALYGSKAKTYPLGVRLRYVATLNRLVDLDMHQKFQELRNRQDGWRSQAQAKVCSSFFNLDTVSRKSKKSLRAMIMEIGSKTGNTKTSLFTSIDKQRNRDTYIIQYHPEKANEATMVITGLYTHITARYGTEVVDAYFKPDAIRNSKHMKWDPIAEKVISELDTEVARLASMDEDMDFSAFAKSEEKKRQQEKEAEALSALDVFQRDRGDDDSVSTMQPGKRSTPAPVYMPPVEGSASGRAKSQSKRIKTSDDRSAGTDTSSLTKGTTKTRLSTVEHSVGQLSNMFKQVMAQNNQIMAALKTSKDGLNLEPEQGQANNRSSPGSTAGDPRGSPAAG
jgi:hypothetical protein